MIEIFKAEDFESSLIPAAAAQSCARRANEKLNAYTQCLEKVYGDMRLGSYHGVPLLWSIDEKLDSTHMARIVSIDRIEKHHPV